MRTETIEWFTPQEKLPDDRVHVMCIFGGKCGVGFYVKKHFEWCGGAMDATPSYWAYIPKGPQ